VLCRYIRGEAEKSSCVTRDVGNVMIDTEITFEYGVRSKNRRQHKGPYVYMSYVCSGIVVLKIISVLILFLFFYSSSSSTHTDYSDAV